MELIHGSLVNPTAKLSMIELIVDRLTLAKRRWRGQASDGKEFAFDLQRPLRHGDTFFQTAAQTYVIVQKPEPVLRIDPASPVEATRVAWQIGNLHFPIMVEGNFVFVEDDIALRQMFEREQTHFTCTSVMFQPLAGSAGHHHHNDGHSC